MARADNERWYRQLKMGDIIIYAVVIMVSLLMLFMAPSRLSGGNSEAGPLQALIIVDGEILHTINENELVAGGEYSFEAHNLHYLVSYENGSVRIEEADCPDQVCVKTGWLRSDGQISACVPGHVLLRIEGEPRLPDGVSSATYEDGPDVVIK